MHKYTMVSSTPPSEMPQDPFQCLQEGEKTAASFHPTTIRDAQYKTTMSQAYAMVWEMLQVQEK